MLDPTRREAILAARQAALAQGVAATFSVHTESSHLMRIGNSSVSLNTGEELTRLDIQVTDGRRQGTQTVMGGISSGADVERALETAIAKARLSLPKDYDPPVEVVEEAVDEDDQLDPGVAELDPAVKAEAYRRVFDDVGRQYNYSGSWSSGVTGQYVVTTENANEAWHVGTDQLFTVVLKDPERRWELRNVQTGWRVGDVSADAAAADLRSQLEVFEARPPHRVEPGLHTVILGAHAIADILTMASWTGLTGRFWEEKQGWTASAAVGDPVLGESVTLRDDPTDGLTFRFGFDLTGKRRHPYPLVERGRLRGLMYDASTAGKYSRPLSGHHLESVSLVMATGDGPEDPLSAVRGMGAVLSIPALHYMHVPNRNEGQFTGSSRFGAVLVEDGAHSRPIFSCRITDTFARVFGQIVALSPVPESVNWSNTYGRRAPVAMSVPAYAVVEGVRITDSADSF
jgi:predicted Zn-dependent protease